MLILIPHIGNIDPRYNERTECDEFPFGNPQSRNFARNLLTLYPGSTIEGGGSNAHVMCIVWWQNSIQGSLIRQYNRFYGIQPNQKFVVRVLPSCDIVSSGGSKRDTQEIQRRQSNGEPSSETVGNTTILSSSYNIWQPNPASTAQDGTGYIFVPLGAVNPGVFNTKLSLQGTVGGLQIIDGDGIEYYKYVMPSTFQPVLENFLP
jgi:hypothetical protein